MPTTRRLGREDITTGHTEVPVRAYRTDGTPAIFAGFRQNWIEGEDPRTGVTFSLDSGAGFGSRYLTLEITLPNGRVVHEYVDITEFVQARVAGIIAEEGL